MEMYIMSRERFETLIQVAHSSGAEGNIAEAACVQMCNDLYKVYAPEWQTGPIPEPTGKCLLIVNPKHNPADPIVIQSKPLVGNRKWLYDLYQYPYQRSVQEVIEVLGTGEWLIQPIILPTK